MHLFSVYTELKAVVQFLNQALRAARTWFIKIIDPVWIVGMSVHVCALVRACVCVRARGYKYLVA